MNIEIEYNLDTDAVPDYAMYTEVGNAGVHGVVVAARLNGWTWAQTYRALSQLSEHKLFAEAMDTMVREIVFGRIGADQRGESFWA